MKKLFFLCILVALLLTACAGGGTNIPEDGVIEIGERFFVMQVTEIQVNASDYLGRSIRFEGLFREEYSAPSSTHFHTVTRNTYGCCGDDGVVGFEVYLPGNMELFPNDTWVSVTGELEEFEYEGMNFFRLRATELVETEAGASFVSN